MIVLILQENQASTIKQDDLLACNFSACLTETDSTICCHCSQGSYQDCGSLLGKDSAVCAEVERLADAQLADCAHCLPLEISRPDELPMNQHRIPCRGEWCFRFLREFLLVAVFEIVVSEGLAAIGLGAATDCRWGVDVFLPDLLLELLLCILITINDYMPKYFKSPYLSSHFIPERPRIKKRSVYF